MRLLIQNSGGTQTAGVSDARVATIRFIERTFESRAPKKSHMSEAHMRLLIQHQTFVEPEFIDSRKTSCAKRVFASSSLACALRASSVCSLRRS